MTDWEKEKGILLKMKKMKTKKQKKKATSNKENCTATNLLIKETVNQKKERILKESDHQIQGWIEGSKQEGWLKFKNK